MEQINNLAPGAMLAVVLNGLGFLLKQTPHVPNWLIPWVLIVAGGAAYPFLPDADGAAVVDVLKGAATALVAVGLHQAFTQGPKE